jgi:site-specific recombinase XerD
MLSEIEVFIQWMRRRNPQARTWRDYHYDLKQLAAITGDLTPATVTFHHIDAFIEAQVARGYSARTINRRLAAVASFYNYLSDEDQSLNCPVLRHRHKLREPQPLPRPVDALDLERFFAVIEDNRDRAMFVLMLRCGLRIAEITAIQLQDLYRHEDYPRLVVRGKGARERSVYLSPQTETALNNYIASRPAVACDTLFLSYLGTGMSTTAVHKRLMRYRERSGVHFSAHQLRHSFASDLVRVETPVTTIQKLLGHRWLETTQVYLKAYDPQVRADFYAACQRLGAW